jgi:hypothetical protein
VKICGFKFALKDESLFFGEKTTEFVSKLKLLLLLKNGNLHSEEF